MSSIYQTWAETQALLEKHQVLPIAVESIHPEEYILHPGSASISSLRLDDHEHRNANPWIKAGGRPQYEGLDGAVTGYVIDGDLTIDGTLINGDIGAPALIVLGNLRAKAIMITGDAKLVVKGNIETDFFMGGFTDSYFVVEGELHARAIIFWDEFAPSHLGTLRGHALVPHYYDAASDENIAQVVPTTPAPDLATLFVPEVQVPIESEKRTFASFGVDGAKLYERIVAGHPVLR